VYAGSYLYDIKGQQPADYKTNIWIQWIEINAIIPLHTVINTQIRYMSAIHQ
jgi:hypothetical protein